MPLLIDIRKLRVINVLMENGAGNVAESLESLAGVSADVAVKSLSMVDPGDIPDDIGDEYLYSASVQLTEPPYGSFIMTFGRETARNIAAHMTGNEVGGELTQFHESALQEMCNIFTSGFIDGIANTLRRSIDMGTPELQSGRGRDLMTEHLSHISHESLAVVLDSQVDVSDPDRAFQVRIFLIPDPGAFVHLLDHLDMDEVRTAEPELDAF
jgi:chemotaxis protein CheC